MSTEKSARRTQTPSRSSQGRTNGRKRGEKKEFAPQQKVPFADMILERFSAMDIQGDGKRTRKVTAVFRGDFGANDPIEIEFFGKSAEKFERENAEMAFTNDDVFFLTTNIWTKFVAKSDGSGEEVSITKIRCYQFDVEAID